MRAPHRARLAFAPLLPGLPGAEAAAEPLLQEVLADHQHARQREVPEDRGDGHRDDLERPAADRPQLEVQLAGHRDRDQQRGVLQHRDRLVAGRRDDDPHRLRQHDPAHRLRAAHPQRTGRLDLAGIHRLDAGPHDLGHVGALGERQPEQAGGEPGEDLVAVEAEEAQIAAEAEEVHQLAVERDAQVVGGVQRTEVGAEEQQDDAGDRAEEPDVGPRGARDDGVRGEPHDREDDAEQDADEHRQNRHDQRRPCSAEDRGREHVVEHEAPLEHRVREQHVHEHRDEHRDQAGGDPPAGVAHRHRLDLLGRCRSRRRLGRHGRGPGQPTAGFTVGSSIAPASTLHVDRTSA